MHSSGMCTARLLTISQHALCGGCLPRGRAVCKGGVCPGGVSAKGVVMPRGVSTTPL